MEHFKGYANNVTLISQAVIVNVCKSVSQTFALKAADFGVTHHNSDSQYTQMNTL